LLIIIKYCRAVTRQAVRAKMEGDHLAEAWHHLKAKNWNKAHSLVIEFIAPDAVVNG